LSRATDLSEGASRKVVSYFFGLQILHCLSLSSLFILVESGEFMLIYASKCNVNFVYMELTNSSLLYMHSYVDTDIHMKMNH